MSQSPETMVYEWKKVTDPQEVALAAVALKYAKKSYDEGIYAIEIPSPLDTDANKIVRELLRGIPNVEQIDFINYPEIDEFTDALDSIAERAVLGNYGIKDYIEGELVGGRYLTYCSKKVLKEAGFTFDDERGTATPPAPVPLPPAR